MRCLFIIVVVISVLSFCYFGVLQPGMCAIPANKQEVLHIQTSDNTRLVTRIIQIFISRWKKKRSSTVRISKVVSATHQSSQWNEIFFWISLLWWSPILAPKGDTFSPFWIVSRICSISKSCSSFITWQPHVVRLPPHTWPDSYYGDCWCAIFVV